MMDRQNQTHHCVVCKKPFPYKALVSGHVIRDVISDEIKKDYPEWSSDSFICRPDLTHYRIQYVHSLLKSEKGELTDLEREVISSMQRHELITKNIETEFDQNWTVGEKLADKIASFGGSWTFLICFGIFLVLWILLNTVV